MTTTAALNLTSKQEKLVERARELDGDLTKASADFHGSVSRGLNDKLRSAGLDFVHEGRFVLPECLR